MADISSVKLELLKLCRDICTRYGLTYFLCGDALGSAVRRGGTIRKEDRLALLMPAADLKNFAAYFKREAPRGVCLQNRETEPVCPFVHTKIRKDGTAMFPIAYKEMPMHHGIAIDLYPYYPVEAGKRSRMRVRLFHKAAKALLETAYVPYQEKPGILFRLLAKLPEEKQAELALRLLKGMERGGKKTMQLYTPFGGGQFFWREALLEEEQFFLSLGGESFRVPDRREVFLNMTDDRVMEGEWVQSADKSFEAYIKPEKKSKKNLQKK